MENHKTDDRMEDLMQKVKRGPRQPGCGVHA